MKKVFVQSFGCRASQADGAAIESSLATRGYATVRNASEADLIVLNTCTVTHRADVDARRLVRTLHNDHPSAQLLVTGCYAQRDPQTLAALQGVRWVVGNSHKSSIADLIAEPEEYHGQVFASPFDRNARFESPPVEDTREDRTRPNLKIQDGCSNACSFCIIPAVRGRSRSAPEHFVIGQMQRLAQNYREVVLSGINLGRWGRDLPGSPRLLDLLRTILEQTDLERLRISSVEPMDWSSALLEFMAEQKRIAPHVHIPLQSGSDAVLKRMCRKYRTRHYATRVQLARELMPHAAVGADVMTGFPGETEAEFKETLEFVEAQPFTYLHVFTYSERPGTPAAAMPGSVPSDIRSERTRRLRQLSDEKNLAFRRRMLGSALEVVTLEQPGMALSGNFLKVQLAERRAPNQLVTVLVDRLGEGTLREAVPFPLM